MEYMENYITQNIINITQKGVKIKNIWNIEKEFFDLFIIVMSQTK